MAIFSEVNRRRHWRKVWVAIAQTKARDRADHAEQLADIEAHADEVNVERSLEIERTLQHDRRRGAGVC